ncbi:MAG TPA: hypothetical protein VIA45_10305 [Thermoanaerobaculia bacterium]
MDGLRVNGVEYASALLPSGFAYRELPHAAADLAPNGSFESGSGRPNGWSWSNDSFSSWSWDSNDAAAGTHSMKISIPGSALRHTPALTSSVFPLAPNTAYTFSCQLKTDGLTASTLTLYFLETDAEGNQVQRQVASASGTTPWTLRSRTFITGPRTVSGSFKAEVFSGYGTGWIDAVQVLDHFAGRSPVPFGGAVTAGDAGLTQTASADGLTLTANFTPAASALRVDLELDDSSGADRAVELSFRLPVDGTGWTWDQDPVTPLSIVNGVRYETLDTTFGAQTHSIYPFATVRNSDVAFTLAVPMGPQMSRLTYDLQTGLRLTWDVGLSASAAKTPSSARLSFWIYSQDPRWGFRSAADKYYYLDANSFTSGASSSGAWLADSGTVDFEDVPNSSDFGWYFLEGIGSVDFGNDAGLLTLHYIDASGWFRKFPGYGEQPPYDVLASALTGDAASSSGTTVDSTPVSEMAKAVLDSSPYDGAGRYQFSADSYFWYANKFQIYPVSPDPDIPAPSMWSVVTKYGVDNRLAAARRDEYHIDGIFIDDASTTFAAVENCREDLWAYSDTPLSFAYSTQRPLLWDGFSMAEFYRAFSTYVHQRGLVLMGSMNPGIYTWFAPSFDVVGGETPGADTPARSYARRVLGQGHPWSNLLVLPGGTVPTSADVLAYLRQALALGFHPGLSSVYWAQPVAYERDRPLFRQYVPLIRTIATAGWKPINGVTVSDSTFWVERFDDETGDVFYLTIFNSGTETRTVQLTLDAGVLGYGSGAVDVHELVRNQALKATRSGPDLLLSDSLGAGETRLYRVTAPRTAPPRRTGSRLVAR